MFGPAKGGHFGVHPAAGCPGGVSPPAAATKAGPAGVWPVGGQSDTMWRLRCKAKDGTHVLQGLSSRTRVRELQGQIAAITGIAPGGQRILVGFPPECLDLSDGDTVLGDLPIQSGKGSELGPAGRPEGRARGRRPRQGRWLGALTEAGPSVRQLRAFTQGWKRSPEPRSSPSPACLLCFPEASSALFSPCIRKSWKR